LETNVIPVISHENLHIIRGDRIKGGAKMLALLRYLPKLNHNHFAYVGSVFGSGAWAVAEACSTLNLQSTLFMAKSDYTPSWLSHIESTGTNLIWYDPLPVETIHTQVTHDYPDISNLPLGFDSPEFITDMASVLKESIQTPPPEIWLSVVSGVLARAACTAFPKSKINAVCVAKNHGDIGHATPIMVPEKFYRPAATPPPYPACPFSDAKLWQFAEKQAVSGAFILNVGV
jgi:hypothetical protein